MAIDLYHAFLGTELIATGNLANLAKIAKKQLDTKQPSLLVFAKASGKQIDLDLSGDSDDIDNRYGLATETKINKPPNKKGRGRPSLGVIGREVTLLPRHWQWLDNQRGGASATLRRLVDQAREETAAEDLVSNTQDKTIKFMSAVGGNLSGFEEATRALYQKDRQGFLDQIKKWPKGLREYLLELSEQAW